jgi:hypothetical protein
MTSAEIGELAKALAAAQGEFPDIPKLCTAKVKTRTGGEYTFKYADLDTILGLIRPILSRHGLAITIPTKVCKVELPPTSNGPAVWTLGMEATVILLHESGQKLVGEPLQVPADPDALRRTYAQALGSAATYAERYAIEAALAIRATQDDDGNNASGNDADVTKDKQPLPPPKPAPKPEPPAKPASQMHPDLVAVLQEFHWPDGHKTEFANKLLANYGTTLAECTKSTETGKAAAFAINGQVQNWLTAHPDETRADALQTLFANIMELT